MDDQIIPFAYGFALRLALYRCLANNPNTSGFFIGFHDSLRLWSILRKASNPQRATYRYHHLAIYYLVETVITRSVTRAIAILLGWIIGALAAEIGPGLWDDLRGVDLPHDMVYNFQAISSNLLYPSERFTSARRSFDYRTASARSAASSLTVKPDSSFEKKDIPDTHTFENLRDPLHNAHSYSHDSEFPAVENSRVPDFFVIEPTDSVIYSDATPRTSSMKLTAQVPNSPTHIHSLVSDSASLLNFYDTNHPNFNTIQSSSHIGPGAVLIPDLIQPSRGEASSSILNDYEPVALDENFADYKTEVSVSESVITTGPEAALIVHADVLRSQAQELHRKIDSLELQRSKAFIEGKFSDAFALKHERDETKALVEKLNERARRRYYKAHNSKPHDPFTIDVHRHNVQEAIRITEVALRDIQRSGGRVLHVIVGRGLHSPRKIPVLRNSVQRALTEQGFNVRINKKNPGLLDVEFPR